MTQFEKVGDGDRVRVDRCVVQLEISRGIDLQGIADSCRSAAARKAQEFLETI